MARKKAARKAASAPKKASPLKGRNKTPPCEAYPGWSEARFFSFIRSTIRSASSRWPPKYECLKAASRPYVGPDKRRKTERQCAHCKEWFPTTQTQADHIIPAGRLATWDDVVPFMQRAFVPVEGYQCLCTDCHSKKTAEERKRSD